jgi:hypothetical protein
MRAALIAFAALMIAAPAHATDPWAESTVSVSAGTAVTETPRSGFGDDFAGVQSGALDDGTVDANALADIAPAAGGDVKADDKTATTTDTQAAGDAAAAVEPAAGDVKSGNPFITEDGGEPVEFAPGDKENKIVGP